MRWCCRLGVAQPAPCGRAGPEPHPAAGFHVTIFAYGQTGSGKTFTMSGREDVLALDDYAGTCPASCGAQAVCNPPTLKILDPKPQPALGPEHSWAGACVEAVRTARLGRQHRCCWQAACCPGASSALPVVAWRSWALLFMLTVLLTALCARPCTPAPALVPAVLCWRQHLAQALYCTLRCVSSGQAARLRPGSGGRQDAGDSDSRGAC